jgi:error-prone DNA polymerase
MSGRSKSDLARDMGGLGGEGGARPAYQSPGARKAKLRERDFAPAAARAAAPLPYAELRAASAFSFLDGASLPEDLVARAAELGLPAVALVDRNGVPGAPRFWKAAKSAGIKPLVGSELTIAALGRGEAGSPGRGSSEAAPHLAIESPDGWRAAGAQARAHRHPVAPRAPVPRPGDPPSPWTTAPPRLTLLAESRQGYQNLCKLVTAAAGGKPKGAACTTWQQVEAHAEGLHVLTGGDESELAARLARDDRAGARDWLERLAAAFPGRVHVELQRHGRRDEERRNRDLVELAERRRLPLVATQGARFAHSRDKPLFDVLTAIRHHVTLDAAGSRLAPNRERHLKSAAEMARLFADRPRALTHAWELSQRLAFTLDDLGYRFPEFPVPQGETPASYLAQVTWSAARARFRPLSAKAQAQIQKELGLIARLDLAGYFLIVWDLVEFCRRERILCQGRGSAANSAVCYALGITAVDPVRMELLFERFLSEERGEWPDIDLDLPSGDQREKVIQYVFRRYGAPSGAPGDATVGGSSCGPPGGGVGVAAAMTANVVTYRDRSAAREVAKALGFSTEQIDKLAKQLGSWRYDLERGDPKSFEREMRAGGFDPDERRVRLFGELWRAIQNLPRHLGQHSGGMVIAAGRLDEVVPIEPAAMPGRSIVQWDKDDCADLGIIKIDLLGLGMLNALEQTIPIVHARERVPLDLAHLPADDPETFAMLRAADTVGVFQVESRAQMASLPRNAPEKFYDLVIQVAIIRPGPITGGMVHPFFERRLRREEVTYFHPSLEPILARTLGVPIFQEQLLRMAMAVSGFTGGEAEELRRAMGFKRSVERMEAIERRLRDGMAARGIAGEAQDRIVQSITSFALYGFPESHAASFALIAYASAYLKCHHPTAFLIGLLNAWPMGFYHPATLVQDARRHGVQVLPIDVNFSFVECVWEEVDSAASRALEKRAASSFRRLPAQPTESAPAGGRVLPSSERFPDPGSVLDSSVSRGARRAPPATDSDTLRGARPASPLARPGYHRPAAGACRLGLRYVDGLRRVAAESIVRARQTGGMFRDADDLARRTGLRADELGKLATVGALASLGLTRREAQWQVALAARPKGELFESESEIDPAAGQNAGIADGSRPAGASEDGSALPPAGSPRPSRERPNRDAVPAAAPRVAPEQRRKKQSPLPEMTRYEQTVADFAATGVTVGAHPMAYWRARLDRDGVVRAAELPSLSRGTRARLAGAVIVRQRPGTAKGTLFLTLEDETGMAQAIVAPQLFQKLRATIVGNPGLVVEGVVESRDGSVSLRAERLWALPVLTETPSHDFR